MTETGIESHIVTFSEDGRYAIWPTSRALPWGWIPEGMQGSRAQCLAHIEHVWTELRPAGISKA